MDHPVQWVTASPLWTGTLASADPTVRSAFRQPALLRFATDSFMNDFLAMMQTDPSQIGTLQVQPETWRSLAPRPVPVTPPPRFALAMNRLRLANARNGAATKTTTTATVIPPGPLKLYQPAHQRYYLLSASLVCQTPGLPDRALSTTGEETASFVVRRLLPQSGALYSTTEIDAAHCDEYAYVTSGATPGWTKVGSARSASAAVSVPGEEQVPLFPVCYTEPDGHPRRIFAALVPVGKRETYLGAPALPPGGHLVPDPSVPASDPRVAELLVTVIEPWKNLVQRALAVRNILNPGPNPPPVLPPPPNTTPPTTSQNLSDLLVAAREQIQTVSWLILLDFANYLKKYLGDVASALANPSQAGSLSPASLALYQWIAGVAVGSDMTTSLTTGVKGALNATLANAPDGIAVSLAAAVQAIGTFAAGMEADTNGYQRSASPPPAGYPWPTFLFPLADPLILNSATSTMPQFSQHVDPLRPLVQAALPALPLNPPTAVPLAAQTPLDPRVGWFVIRCVYNRPYCGPLDPPVVSDPTPPFQMAAFFDPDAPARPLRIVLPLDTSPAGLRKYDKNTAFMISDVLCNQISGLSNVTLGDLVLSVLPWPFHKDLNVSSGGDGSCNAGIGTMCTFSLPIITICAMLILMIFVKLLDVFLFWMVFFRICLPLPNFKGKD